MTGASPTPSMGRLLGADSLPMRALELELHGADGALRRAAVIERLEELDRELKHEISGGLSETEFNRAHALRVGLACARKIVVSLSPII